MHKLYTDYSALEKPNPSRPDVPAEVVLSVRSQMQWSRLPVFKPDPDNLKRNRIITFDRTDPVSSAFDLLRTRVMQKMRRGGWCSLAITSPTIGSGKSLTSVNLAFSIAHNTSCRSALVDLDLRRPQIADIVGLNNVGRIADFLSGGQQLENTFVRCAESFAIAANSQVVPRPAELLENRKATEAVRQLKDQLALDMVIYDLPPMLANDDVLAFIPNVDCALLVLEAGVSTPEEADQCERELSQITNVLGLVLNKCRFAPETQNYY